jgi:hypothetical protein
MSIQRRALRSLHRGKIPQRKKVTLPTCLIKNHIMNKCEGVEFSSTDSSEHSKRVVDIPAPYFGGLHLCHVQVIGYANFVFVVLRNYSRKIGKYRVGHGNQAFLE